MKKLLLSIVIIAGTLLGGCSDRLEGWEVRQAQELCKSNGGVAYVSIFNHHAYCANGKILKLERP